MVFFIQFQALSFKHFSRLPFAGQPVDLMSNPTIRDVGEKYTKSPAQVLLRNLVQREIAIIPKSSTPARIKENTQVINIILFTDL